LVLRASHYVSASQLVRTASVALTGFTLDFKNPEGDRSLNVISVILNMRQVTASAVDFVAVQLADKNFDDEYRGVVGILMIADVLEPPFTVPVYQPEQLEIPRNRTAP
jgi:hypothetical protein